MAKAGKRKGGPPTKLTAERRKTIVEAIESGVSIEGAAGLVGIDARTLERWLAADRDGICRDVAGARARRETALVGAIAGSASGPGMHDWKASAWLLERSHPDQYADAAILRTKLNAEVAAILDGAREVLDPESYRRLLTAVASRGVGG